MRPSAKSLCPLVAGVVEWIGGGCRLSGAAGLHRPRSQLKTKAAHALLERRLSRRFSRTWAILRAHSHCLHARHRRNCLASVAWWRNGWGVGLAIQRSRVRLPAVPLSGNNLGQVVLTHICLCHCHQAGEWLGAGVVICLERGADLHVAQLMPLPLTVSCFSKIQIGFAFLVPAHPGSPGQRAVKRVCVWLLNN